MTDTKDKYFLELKIYNDLKLVPMTLRLISDFAQLAGFNTTSINKIEMASEEGIVNVIKHAFKPNEVESFRIQLHINTTSFVISILDQGLPFDPNSIQYDEETHEGLGSYVMSKMMDKIQYINHGKGGKELKMVKYFDEDQSAKQTASAPPPTKKTDVPLHSTEFTYRISQDKDAIEISRCAYESYGYTYAYEHIYFPERVKALNKSGELISFVAEASDGQIAGHIALVKIDGYKGLYEIGLAMTKQNFRGGSVFSKLLRFVYQEIDRRDIYAVFGQCVTTHTYSQSAPVKSGMIPTALLPAYVPDDITFKNISENKQKRTAVLIVSQIKKPTDSKQTYLPEKYRSLVGEIYRKLHLSRQFLDTEIEPIEMTEYHLSINANLKMAKVLLKNYGKDFNNNIQHIIQQLKKEGVSMAETFVNINHPSATRIIEEAEAMGFRFTGIIPGSLEGDIGILQYLNGIESNIEQIKVLPEGQTLLEHIEKQFDKY